MRIRTKDTSELTGAVLAARAAKNRLIDAQLEYDQAEIRLVEVLRSNERKSTTVSDGDKMVRATVTQRETVKVDEPSLRKAVGAKVFDALCTKKLSTSLLKEAVAEGVVDAVVVAQHSQVTMGKAYITFSQPEEKEPDD